MAIRSLRARPSRTLLTTAGIVLGVAVIFAISITNESTLSAVASVFGEASGKANLIVASSESGGAGFPEQIRRRVIAVPGVKAAVRTLQIQTVLADASDSPMGGFSMMGPSFGGLTVYGIDPKLEPDAREYEVVAGEFLPDDLDVYEILLVDEYAIDNELEVGGDVTLLTPSGAETLRVIGPLAKDGTAQRYNGAFGIVPLGAAQKLFSWAGSLDQIDIVATAENATGGQLDVLKAAVQDRLGDAYSVTFPATQGESVSQMLTGYQMGLNFFSVIALFVGAFLIYNTFSMTVAERTREIGMLRTVGMTQRQVMRQILLEALILAVAGCALGLLAGIVLSRGLTLMMEVMIAQKVEQVRIPLGGLFLSAAVGFFVTIAAVAVPVNMRLGPHELRHILSDCEASAVITIAEMMGRPYYRMIQSLRPALPKLRHLIVKGAEGGEGIVSLEEAMASADPATLASAGGSPDDVCALFYTSGTTGVPKGAMHTHRGALSICEARRAVQSTSRACWPHIRSSTSAQRCCCCRS